MHCMTTHCMTPNCMTTQCMTTHCMSTHCLHNSQQAMHAADRGRIHSDAISSLLLINYITLASSVPVDRSLEVASWFPGTGVLSVAGEHSLIVFVIDERIVINANCNWVELWRLWSMPYDRRYDVALTTWCSFYDVTLVGRYDAALTMCRCLDDVTLLGRYDVVWTIWGCLDDMTLVGGYDVTWTIWRCFDYVTLVGRYDVALTVCRAWTM